MVSLWQEDGAAPHAESSLQFGNHDGLSSKDKDRLAVRVFPRGMKL
jgi:hypothetical protein